jgi:death-on-curing protein
LRAELIWIEEHQLLELAEEVLGSYVVRDLGLLQGTLTAPINLHNYEGETDLLILGVRLLNAVAMAHPLQDGNKRLAFHALAMFLRQNGALLAAPDTERTAEWVVALVERKISPGDLCVLLRPFVVMPFGA